MKQYKRYTRLIVFAILIVAILFPMIAAASGAVLVDGLSACRRAPNGMNCRDEYGVRRLICNPGFHKEVVGVKVLGSWSFAERCVS
mgnify:CR=1 FL=1